MRRPIYLSGKVILSDGIPPPDFVTMYLVCNGQPRPQGYTDSKGRFSISLGDNNAMMADASVGSATDPFGDNSGSRSGMSGGPLGRGGMTERELMNCELKAELPGYRSDVVSLAGRRIMDNPDIGTIILHRLANVEGFTYSMTTALAPKDARKAYDKGLDRMKKKKWNEAQIELEKAVSGYPKYAVAWYELGRAYSAQKNDEKALEAFLKSTQADAKFVSPQLELLQLAVNERNWEKIERQADTVLKLNPYDYPQVWFFHSVASYNLKNLDAAEKSAREAAKLDTNHRNPKINHLLGVILADRGEYSGALDQMRTYLNASPNAPDAANVKNMVTELEKLSAAKKEQQ
jgi:tetratricopeptide (TPR) repeat protein